MTEKEYRSHPAISRSELWKMNESPEKFKYYRDHPQPPTPSLLFGQVVHKLLLQPDDFDSDFAIAPELDRRTKAGKDAYNAFCDGLGGRSVVAPDMYLQAVEMAQKAISEPYVKKLLTGEKEVPFFWTDHDTGEACKVRLDNRGMLSNLPFLMDYKTCSDASNDAFRRDAIKWGYDFQSAMYLEGYCQNVFGKSVLAMLDNGQCPPFIFTAQEKAPPYSVNIFTADEAFIRRGYDIFRELIGKYHYCKETGDWYGYLGKESIINTLDLPSWMKGDNE